MLLTIVSVIYVLVAIAMIVLILMQRGSGAAAGSGFGGGASATVFGARGSADLLSTATMAAETYTIDPGHSQVRFEYNHLGFSNIVGLIGEVSGEIVFDSADPSKSSVTATIPLTSIQTGYAKMNDHLAKDDFFDVAKFPEASFVSTSVESMSADPEFTKLSSSPWRPRTCTPAATVRIAAAKPAADASISL